MPNLPPSRITSPNQRDKIVEKDRNRSSVDLNRLTDAEMRELRKHAEAYKRANERFAKAVGTLWNAQLDASRSAGRGDLAAEVKPLHLFNDCSCC
jgi:hypothetical protein